MRDRVISSRYAKVLFNLDRDKNHLEQRLKDFELIIDMINSHPDLAKFLKSPQIELEQKEELMRDSLKGKIDPVFLKFLSFLILKRRLPYLQNIEREYKRLVHDLLGIWETELVTAVPIDGDIENKFVQKLEKLVQKKIVLHKKIDPKILGGAILIVSNEILDWSVTNRLEKLKETLMATQI
jgi:F-type H+-transporting ATPase subunit delta